MSLETDKADKKQRLRLVSCANGEDVATIGAQDLPDGDLAALIPVPSCGLVVAQYEKGDVIVDVAAKRLRPDLAKLISDTLPVDWTRSWSERARWAFKGLPGTCTLYGLALEFKPKAKSIVPTRLVAFDLRARQARLLKSFAYDKSVEGVKKLFPAAKMAVSPSGRVVAIHFSRDGGISAPLQERPHGIADLLLTDLQSDRPERTLDVRRSPSVRDIALLSDSEVLLLANWLDHFQASVLDLKSMGQRVLCTGGFGLVKQSGYSIHGQRSPSAIAVNTKLNLLAAVIHNDVRVLRYKRNPAGTYANGPAEC
jgi:hypothetical protein